MLQREGRRRRACLFSTIGAGGWTEPVRLTGHGSGRGSSRLRLRHVLHVGVHGLLLALNVLHQLLQRAEARLDLVDRVVERLDLAGDLVDLAVLRLLLGLHLFLQTVERDGHLVDGVGALLDEVLHDAHALVVGLLQARDRVLQLLNLRLQLHHVFVDGEGRRTAEEDGREQECGGATNRLEWRDGMFGGMIGALMSHGRITLGFLSSCQPSRDELCEG